MDYQFTKEFSNPQINLGLRRELQRLSIGAYGVSSKWKKLMRDGELVTAKIIKGEIPHKVWKQVTAERAIQIMDAKIEADKLEVAKLEALKAEKEAKLADINAQVAAQKLKDEASGAVNNFNNGINGNNAE